MKPYNDLMFKKNLFTIVKKGLDFEQKMFKLES